MSSFATLLLSLAVTASHSPAQEANPIVSATVRAAPAPRAIEELSKQIGVPLSAMPSVKNDILIIRVEKVRLQDLLARIAEAIHAGWQKDGSGYRLVRDDAMRRDELAKDIVSETENYREGLEEQKKKLADQGQFDEKRAEYLAERIKNFHDRFDPQSQDWGREWQATQEVTEQSPANRATLRICAALTAEQLAALPFDKKVVFSSKPTRMQRPMPGNLTPIIDQFRKEAALMSTAVKRKLGDREMNWQFGDDSLYGKAGGTPTKFLLMATRYEAWGGVQLTLQIANEKGRWMGSGNAMIGRSINRAEQDMQGVLKDSAKEEPAKLSPGSEAMFALFKAYTTPNSAMAQPPSGEVRKQFLRPDLYDPLSYIATDVLLNAAEVKHLNLVGSLPDMLSFSLGFTPEVSRPSVVLKALSLNQSGGQVKDGWLTISPPNQSHTRESRIDRVALAQCLAASEKKGKLALDDVAAFARKNTSNQSLQFLSLWRSLIAGSRIQEANWDWDALRFYGTLSTNQWQSINAKRPIAFRSFTPEQQNMLHAMVYDKQWSNLQVNPQNDDFNNLEGMDWDEFYNGLMHEPTESLPDGIPYDGTLTVNIDRGEVAFLGDIDGNPQWVTGRAYTAGELAWEMFSRERKDLFPWQNQPGQAIKFDSFRFGERMLVNLQFRFNKMLSLNQSLQENTYGTSGQVPLSGLPATFRKALEEQMAQYKEQYKNVKPGDFGDGGGGTKQTIPPARP